MYLAENGRYKDAYANNLSILSIALLAYPPWFLFELVTLNCDRKPHPEQYSVVQVMVQLIQVGSHLILVDWVRFGEMLVVRFKE